jgi:YD repeat-containing protein
MRGNLIKRTEPWQTQRFCYDPLDRLIEAVIEDKRICYSYDPLGRKLKKTVEISGNEQKECFFYDGKNEIGVASDKGEIKQLKVLGLGDHPEKRNAVAIELGGKAYAPLIDVQGNVRALVDMTSKVLAASYDYSAFGKQLPLPNRVFSDMIPILVSLTLVGDTMILCLEDGFLLILQDLSIVITSTNLISIILTVITILMVSLSLFHCFVEPLAREFSVLQ